jgi:phosphorylcholine metabolism protein LicD
MLRKILAFIARKIGVYKYAIKLDSYLKKRQRKRAFDKYALEALIQADKAFKDMKAWFFLDFGTLLGAYRDKDFIPHDDDLDVAVLYEIKPQDMKKGLQQYGFKHENTHFIKDNNKVVVDTYYYKGVCLDFFIYYKEDTGIYAYLPQSHETKDSKKANMTDGFPTIIHRFEVAEFLQMEFLGHNFYIPANTSRWLESIYGSSYMTPIKNFHHGEFLSDPRIKLFPHTERVYTQKI